MTEIINWVSQAYILEQLNLDLMDTDCGVNSVHCHLDRAGGHVISNDITINADNASANVECFQITGSIEIYRIYGTIKTKTTLANCTAVYFDLFPTGWAAVAISKNNGVLSGLAVWAFFTKEAVATTTITIIDNALAVVTEPVTDKKQFTPFIVTQKTGVDTFIRFNYTTTDTPADAVFGIYVEYRKPPEGEGTIVAA